MPRANIYQDNNPYAERYVDSSGRLRERPAPPRPTSTPRVSGPYRIADLLTDRMRQNVLRSRLFADRELARNGIPVEGRRGTRHATFAGDRGTNVFDYFGLLPFMAGANPTEITSALMVENPSLGHSRRREVFEAVREFDAAWRKGVFETADDLYVAITPAGAASPDERIRLVDGDEDGIFVVENPRLYRNPRIRGIADGADVEPPAGGRVFMMPNFVFPHVETFEEHERAVANCLRSNPNCNSCTNYRATVQMVRRDVEAYRADVRRMLREEAAREARRELQRAEDRRRVEREARASADRRNAIRRAERATVREGVEHMVWEQRDASGDTTFEVVTREEWMARSDRLRREMLAASNASTTGTGQVNWYTQTT